MGHNVNCKALRNRYKCSICQKGFMREYAKKNHERQHKELIEAMEKHPERYGK